MTFDELYDELSDVRIRVLKYTPLRLIKDDGTEILLRLSFESDGSPYLREELLEERINGVN